MRRAGRSGAAMPRRHAAGPVRVPAGSCTPSSPVRRRRKAFDPALIAECGQWTLASGHTTGTVTLVPAPTDRRCSDGGHGHRGHDRRRGWYRNQFACRHLHRLPGRLPRVRHRRHRPRLAESHTRTGIRRGIAGENGVGVTGLKRRRRVHWRRCSTRGRCSSSHAPAYWRRARPDSRRRRMRADIARVENVKSSFGPQFQVTWGRRASTRDCSLRRRCRPG